MTMSFLTKGPGNLWCNLEPWGVLTLAFLFPHLLAHLPTEFCIPSSVSHFYFPNMVFLFLPVASLPLSAMLGLPYGVLPYVSLSHNVLPLLAIQYVLHGF